MSSLQGGETRSVDLAQVSIPRLVFALLHQRFTGTLALPQPGSSQARSIWFRGGMPVFTDWHAPTQMLGQVLIHHRLLTDGDLYPALAQASSEGQLLGRCLVGMGRIDAEQLTAALRDQCARKLALLFPMRAGTVQVTTGDHDLGHNDELVGLNVLELIQAGVGVHYDEARVTQEMGPALAGRFRATAALHKYASHFRFRPADAEILDAITRGSDLDGLAAMPGVTRNRATQLVYTLWACQMLHVGGAAADVPSQPPPARKRSRTYSRITPTRETRPDVALPGQTGSRTDLTEASRAAKEAGFTPIKADAPRTPAAATPPPRTRTRADLDSPVATAPPAPSAPTPTPTPTPAPRKRQSTMPNAAAHTPEAEAEFVADLERYETLLTDSAHAFDLFGLPLDAGKRDVRRAWGDLSRKYHPDALKPRGLDHLRERVGAVFASLSEAHQVLADVEQRDKLRRSIEGGSFGRDEVDESATVRAALEADVLTREADKLLRNHAYTRALAKYREAISLSPDEPDTQAAILWCEYMLSSRTSDDAVRTNAALDAILTQWPNTARAHYYRGFSLMELGHEPLAIAAFKQAHTLDPRMIDAQRQARALHVRTQAAATPKTKRTGLRGLFGKK